MHISYTHTYIYIYIYIYTFIYIYINMYIYVYKCIYTFIYIHTCRCTYNVYILKWQRDRACLPILNCVCSHVLCVCLSRTHTHTHTINVYRHIDDRESAVHVALFECVCECVRAWGTCAVCISVSFTYANTHV